jgi:hypothetical protein
MITKAMKPNKQKYTKQGNPCPPTRIIVASVT